MPVNATRRFVLGTALATVGAAKVGTLLQPVPASPYAGAPVRGAGASTTVLDVTDTTYGAKGDGVLLGDLVVQAGSSSIDSATGPFTTTSRDRGKTVLWRTTSDGVGTGVIDRVESPTRAVLRDPASTTSRADGGPNTNGMVGTDNTAALDAAFAAAQAAAAAVPADRRAQTTVVEVHIPRGVFLLTRLAPFTQAGVVVTGEGRYSSVLASAASGAWFQLGDYESSPSDAYQGTATGWTFSDLQFINPVFRSGSAEGHRTGRAVQDNGSGGTRILACGFTGLEIGFCAAYGSDFSQIRDCAFYLCDIGYYVGPGSQQLDIAKTDASQCREGAVFEGAPQWHIGSASSFEDPSVAAITIEAAAQGRTRLGLPVDLQGAFYAGSFVVDGGTWFEMNSGDNGRLTPRLIWMHGDGPFGVPAEGLTVRDAYVVAGGTRPTGAAAYFVEYTSGLVSAEPVVLDGVTVTGEYLSAVFRMSGSATTSSPRLIGVQRPKSVALTSGPATGAKIMEPDGSIRWSSRSGVAQGGALLEAFASASSSGGRLEIDSATANHFSCDLTGGTTSLVITNAPEASGQRLTVELVARAGLREADWPSDCRFEDDAAPQRIASGTRTCVTFAWNPKDQVWLETARTESVPI